VAPPISGALKLKLPTPKPLDVILDPEDLKRNGVTDENQLQNAENMFIDRYTGYQEEDAETVLTDKTKELVESSLKGSFLLFPLFKAIKIIHSISFVFLNLFCFKLKHQLQIREYLL
jgi:hypothetical protein